jgi:TolB-like protein/tetratricopeptide (TPR) repeat protein
VTHERHLNGDRLPAEQIRAQLDRILGSRAFAQAPILSRLLRYLVERTADGQPEDLKEYTVGVEVFGRGASFDPRTDTIVRVQARRLRSRLQDYYRDEGASDLLVLDVPKGGYAVRWQQCDAPVAAPPPAGETPAQQQLASEPSIVVLPFANLSGDPDNEYFSDGLTEEIISGLAAVPDVRVVARTSAFQFKGRAGDIRTIGRDLGVRAALEGSVRRAGQRVRATVQLIDVACGFHLWSETFDRELTDVFGIQDDITRAIVDALRLRLTATGAATPGDVPPAPKPEAYEWYLKGRFFYHKATPRSLEKSVRCMERAIACDARFAAAFAGLADAYTTWMSLAVEEPLAELLAKARQAAETALQIDPRSAEGHCARAVVAAVADWDFTTAEQSFLHALELKPSFVHARMAYSVTCLTPQRRHDEAVTQLRVALRSDPMSILLQTMLGQALVVAGQADPAVDRLRQTLELDPEYVFARYTLALAYLAQSRLADALALLETGDHGGASNYIGHLGYTYARLGHRVKARRLLQELLRRPWAPGVDVAAIYNGLGDTTNAATWLERARAAREFDVLFIADDPRFRDLLSAHPTLRAALGT